MTPSQYQELAMRTEANQEVIRERIYACGDKATRLDGGLRGLMDEVGELASVVKKWLEYGQALNTDNIKEECGDVMWRLCQILKACGLSLEEVMQANIRKLAKRYPNGFTDFLAADENRNLLEESKALINGAE